MFTPENIEILSKIIIEHAKTSPTILGARLGDIVKQTFPGENIKSNYGSVAKFVNAHFSSMLTLSGRHGVDNVYSFSPAILQEAGNVTEIVSDKEIKLQIESEAPKTGNSSAKQQAVPNDAATVLLREAVIDSIRIMTIEQLRQLPIPAGILLDAIRKANRL